MLPSSPDIPELIVSKSPDFDENKERGNWSSGLEFLLSCLSYAVGLGNIWRFPYLCYRNGGGVFLIPYTIMLLFVGLPLFFMELAFGQYASEGPITIWTISPLFQGLGYAMFLMSALVGIYYNMILAWALFYLFSSFTSELPWASCDNHWNTNACRKFDSKNCTSLGGLMDLTGRCVFNDTVSPEIWKNLSSIKLKTPSDEYFHNFVLDITTGLHDLGGMRFELAGCLLICWLIVFGCLYRGVKSIGKVVYFTALFPYIVLTILLVHGLTLDGASDGIKFYLMPDWPRLFQAEVWKDAAMQIFFSLSPCWGGLITLASYNKFHNNCFRDAMFIAFGNCGTSFFAGFVIFSVVGFMSHQLGVPVSEVAKQGAGLAFVVYPEAVSKLPFSPVWSFLFFSMLLTLGLGTQFTLIETVVTGLVDTWPHRLRHRKAMVLFVVCSVMFTLGLGICTNGGMYILQLMDDYCASFSALIIGFVEVVVIGWIYGIDRFLDDAKVMLGHYPFPHEYWRNLLKFVTPLLILFILFSSWIYSQPSYYDEYQYPAWASALGYCLSFVSVSAIPFIAFLKIKRERGPIIQRIQRLMKPTDEWGPKLQLHRMETHSPKHTDSQVPLASHYENDDDSNDSDQATSKSPSNLVLADDPSDSDAGLRLTVPRSFGETNF